MTCLILDDEEICIHQLRQQIQRVPTLTLKAYFTDPKEALLYLETEKVDVIFLDIEMPNYDIDGLDFARIMGDSQRYIFTTGYPKYALPSYEYNAVYFLHKPYTFESFTKAVQRAKQLIGAAAKEIPEETYIYVRGEGQLQRVDYGDICWIESERNGCWFYTETNKFNSTLTISDIEAQLPQNQFIRIHKSYIIAINKAETIKRETLSVRRQGKLEEIPIGDVYKKDFNRSIENKIMKK